MPRKNWDPMYSKFAVPSIAMLAKLLANDAVPSVTITKLSIIVKLLLDASVISMTSNNKSRYGSQAEKEKD